jgi:radical SAM protein with 4Fe4S-binding SPASM domain
MWCWSRLCRSLVNNNSAFVDNIYIHSEDNRVLYLNPDVPDWITINEKYKPIFNLIDNDYKKNTLINFIKTNYSDEAKTLIPQINSLLQTSKIFRWNNKKIKYRNNNVVPNSIYLTLTDNCNLDCVYCYATERKKNSNTTLEKWKKYVNSIIDFAGTPTFTFTGGEPLTIPYVYDLATYIKNRGCVTILLTNGTLINTEEKANIVSKSFDLIKISLDTIDENVSKDLRGVRVSEQVKYAFMLLNNKKCNTTILATVTSKTCDNLDDFSTYFNNQVNFQPLYQMGRSKNNINLCITGEQYYNALTKKSKFNLLHGYRDNISDFRNKPCKRCAMAETELSINSNGDVFPCHLLHYSEFISGNLNNQSFGDIYSKSVKLRELRKINVDNIPQCKLCNFRNFCGSACRARINNFEADIMGNDDFCIFEQKEILDALMYSYG